MPQSTSFGRAPMPPAGYPSNLRYGYASPRLLHTGDRGAHASTDFNDISPGATTTTYVGELFAPCSFVTTGVAVFNGSATGSASIKVALFDASGQILLTTGAVALSGTDAYQRIPWASEFISTPGTLTALVSPQLLPPGTYFIGETFSTTTTVKLQTFAGVQNFGAGTVTSVYATAFATTSLTLVPPTTYTTAEGPVASLY